MTWPISDSGLRQLFSSLPRRAPVYVQVPGHKRRSGRCTSARTDACRNLTSPACQIISLEVHWLAAVSSRPVPTPCTAIIVTTQGLGFVLLLVTAQQLRHSGLGSARWKQYTLYYFYRLSQQMQQIQKKQAPENSMQMQFPCSFQFQSHGLVARGLSCHDCFVFACCGTYTTPGPHRDHDHAAFPGIAQACVSQSGGGPVPLLLHSRVAQMARVVLSNLSYALMQPELSSRC